MAAHKDVVGNDNHTPYTWIFTTVTDRLNFTTVDASLLYKKAFQLDNETEYVLASVAPLRWKQLSATNFVPTVVSSKLNSSPVTSVIATTIVTPSYPLMQLTTSGAVTLISVPNILPGNTNGQELSLIYLGSNSLVFQGESTLPNSRINNTFTLNTTNRLKKLVYSTVLSLWMPE